MSKRNKPASLTSSLLARKGEAEPAIEPYSFLDSNDGGANSPPRDSAGPDGGGRINGSADPSGPTAVMNMNSADETGDGVSTTDGGRGPAGGDDGGAGDCEDKSEAVRDRRLLRFVYVTAALTGILAIVLYAGDWVFNSSTPAVKQAEAPAETATETAQPDSAPAQEPAVTGTNGRKRVTRLKLSEPPAPPAPVSPPQNAPVVETAVPKLPPPETVESTGSGETAAEAMKSTVPVAPGGETPAAKPEAPSMAMPVEKPVAPSVETPAPPPASPEPSAAAAEKAVPAPPPAKPEVATPEPPVESPAPATATTKKKPPTVASAPATASSSPKVSASGRYLAQLGSVTSEAGARRFWGKVQKKFPAILGGYDMIMEKHTIAKRGTFYRVQVGRFATIKEARGLCDALKKRKQGCLPIKR